MDVLVFGGTVFVSRTVVETALAAGHRVTAVNRGLSGEPVDGATTVTGDRTDPDLLARLAKDRWDLVVDTGYAPSVVRPAAEALADSAAHYCFVSSINVYPGWPETPDYVAGGVYEAGPDDGDGEGADGSADPSAYGRRKVVCELAVERAFGPERTSLLRAGGIIGPYDAIGRLPWWLDRVARGGEVLVPGLPEQDLSLVDARDLAAYALRRAPGAVEVTGPVHELTRGELFGTAAEVTGATPHFVWVGEQWPVEQGLAGWTELPLWHDLARAPSLFDHHPAEAVARGLRARPVRDSLADTWAWMRSIPGGWQRPDGIGLDPDKERDLLRRWGDRAD